MKKLLFITLIFYFGSIYSLTNISGDVNGTWNMAGSPYHIIDDTRIPVGDVLTIEAGVLVIFDDDYEFRIRGQLLANGAAGSEITFMSFNPLLAGWQGLYFMETITNLQPASVLNYCDISGGDTVSGGGIICWYAEIEVNDSNIHDNTASADGGGVYAAFSTLTFNDVDIQDNTANRAGGFDCHGGNTISLTNVNILNNDASTNTGGMAIVGSPSDPTVVTMNNVLVDGNTSHGYGGGLYIGEYNPDVTFDTVTISNNDTDIGYGGGLYLWSNVTLTYLSHFKK